MKFNLFIQVVSFLPGILSTINIEEDGKHKTESLELFDNSSKEPKLKSVSGPLPKISEKLKEEIQHYAIFAGASYCGSETKTKKYDELCSMKYSSALSIEYFQKRNKLISKEICQFCTNEMSEYSCCSGTRSQENNIRYGIDEEINPKEHVETGVKTSRNFKFSDKRNNKLDSSLTFQCNYCNKIDGNITRIWNGDFDDAAFIVRDKSRNQIVITFRGSHDFIKFLSSTVTKKTTYDFGDNLSVNERYLHNLKSLLPKIKESTKKIINGSNSKLNLVLVGHSLGGALATLAAPYLAEALNLSPSKIKIFTFGQPRVGDEAFARWYNSQKFNFIRVVNSCDPIVKFPYRDDWVHVQNEVWIHQSNYFDCKSFELENPRCGSNLELPLNNEDHSYVDNTFLSTQGCSNYSYDSLGPFCNIGI